jgi:hypothetical protein
LIRNYIDRLQRGSEVIILILSAFAVILFLYVSLTRFTYPFDLEWCEGSLLDHACRIIDGKPYYIPPAPDFIPTAYPPVYYFLIVFIWKILGVNMWSVRLLSIISTLLIALFIVLISRKYNTSYIYSIAAAGFFLSCYKVTGSWFDLARIDMISLLLFMIALYLGLTKEGNKSLILSGLIAGLSCMTKQNFIILSMIIPLNLILQKRWQATIFFLLPFALLISSMMLILHKQTEGWSNYYIYTAAMYIPSTPFISTLKLILFKDFGLSIIPSVILLIVLAYLALKREINLRSVAILILFLFFAYFQAFNNRLRYGSFVNQYIPFFVAISILIWVIVTRLERKNLKLILTLLITIQMVIFNLTGKYGRIKHGDWISIDRFNTRLEYLLSLGSVFIPNSGFWTRYHGGETTIHYMSLITNATLKEGARTRDTSVIAFKEAFSSQHYAVLILSSESIYLNPFIRSLKDIRINGFSIKDLPSFVETGKYSNEISKVITDKYYPVCIYKDNHMKVWVRKDISKEAVLKAILIDDKKDVNLF